MFRASRPKVVSSAGAAQPRSAAPAHLVVGCQLLQEVANVVHLLLQGLYSIQVAVDQVHVRGGLQQHVCKAAE